MIHEPKKTVSLQVPQPLYDRLKSLADYDTRTLAAEIRQILKGYVEYIDRGGVSWCQDGKNRGIEQYTQ